MAVAVVTIAAGGLPVVDVTATKPALGLPVTEAVNGRGIAVTKVSLTVGGLPVTFVATGNEWPAGGGGPTFPASVTGVIGWWDASVTASLTLAGSSIDAIADQSGGGNTMTWVNAKPTYSATGFNSAKPAIVLGPSSALVATPFPMGAGNTLTAWYVGTVGGVDSGRALNYFKPGFPDYNNAGSWAVLRSSSTAVQFYRNSGPTTISGLTAHPAPYRFIFTVNSSGIITPYVNGVAGGTVSTPGNWVTAGTAQIGRQDGTSGNYWTGPIAEAGIATGYSDATAVAALDTYLKTKWGL